MTIPLTLFSAMLKRSVLMPPATVPEMERCKPVFEEHEGWKQDLSGLTDGTKLPAKAKAYLDRIAELAGARISLLGIGPAREQTLVLG